MYCSNCGKSTLVLDGIEGKNQIRYKCTKCGKYTYKKVSFNEKK